MGGPDHALLRADEEWRHPGQLAPKVWMALNRPARVLEFDARTLTLRNTDRDGRIRSTGVLDAVAWGRERVRHPSRLTESSTGLPLDNLRDDTPQGAEPLPPPSWRGKKSGLANAGEISPEHACADLTAVTGYAFNGDGVVPPAFRPHASSVWA